MPLPGALNRGEARAWLDRLEGAPRLTGGLLRVRGLRVLACPRLSVRNVDFASSQNVVRGSKGDKGGVALLPVELEADAAQQLAAARAPHRDGAIAGAVVSKSPTARAC